jgi:hypothetical protein
LTMNRPNCIHSRLAAFFGGIIVVAAAGCGSRLGEVKGTVTCQGKVVCSGMVLIRGSDRLAYNGTIEDDGSYTVTKEPRKINLVKLILLILVGCGSSAACMMQL